MPAMRYLTWLKFSLEMLRLELGFEVDGDRDVIAEYEAAGFECPVEAHTEVSAVDDCLRGQAELVVSVRVGDEAAEIDGEGYLFADASDGQDAGD